MPGLNNVSSAFNGWTEVITVTSFATGNYVAGTYAKGVSSDRDIDGVIQNATPDDLQVIPEGMRTEEAIKIHTTEILKPVSGKNIESADLIAYDGDIWCVYSVANRKIGNYYKAIAIRELN